MSLRMPGPILVNGVYHLNQRTPSDLGNLIGRKIQLPVAGVARVVTVRDVVRLSLRTREAKVAKARHAEADRALRQAWARARAAPAAAPAPAPVEAAKDIRTPEYSLLTEIVRENGAEPSARNIKILLDEHAAIMAAAVPDWAGSYRLTVLDLWERWKNAHKTLVERSTVVRYTPSMQSFAAFVGDKDVRSIKSDDVYAWAIHRRDNEMIAPRTINNNDLAAAGSVLRWATTREGGRILATAPMDDVKVPEGKRNEGRRFRDEEVTAILLAALSVEIDPRNPTRGYALRWTPWLAAYSGARIGELTALTGPEVHLVDQVWAMHFPETKTDEARTVPIHDHLLEMGFIEFVKSRGAGPLFYDPTRHTRENARTSPSDNRAQKIAKWVREVARLPADVDPNHGWRHTFKSRAAPYIDQRMRDAITGHAPGTIGGKYEKFSTRELATALIAFPRYDVEVDQG